MAGLAAEIVVVKTKTTIGWGAGKGGAAAMHSRETAARRIAGLSVWRGSGLTAAKWGLNGVHRWWQQLRQ